MLEDRPANAGDRAPEARRRDASRRRGIPASARGRLGVSPRPALTEGYDAVFLDLDGVVYRGDTPISGVPEVLRSLSAAGVPKAFLTNNASRTPEQVAEALKRMGVDAAADEVLTSAVATAELLAREGYAGSRAYAVGERGVRTALAGVGILVVDEPSAGADLVVVGWDRSVDYDKLRNASLLVERGARLVATNADASYPAPDGLWPGAGAILAAITTTTGATPTVVGKPERGMFDAAAARCGATHPLVVGDRLDTDVRGAAGAGMDSLLVLSGAASATDLLDASDLPTFLGADLRALERPLVPVRPRVAAAED
ncbi:MAG: HAD-IIA family hydrolase, partial [Actinobacteria bacterium]